MSGPYGVASRAYFEAGWSPVPFPPRSKWPPVDNFTGGRGKYVDEVTLRRWLKAGAEVSAGKLSWKASDGNIGLRLPNTVLGIDVDMYGEKSGRSTLAAAEEAWGKLPDTWFSSSRPDGSGIRLFRIPAGLAWPGQLPFGGGVELCRWDHRYVIVAPSLHDETGEPYRWWRIVDGVATVDAEEFPDPPDLPDLPAEWVEGLTNGRKWVKRDAKDLDADDVRLWISDRNGPEACAALAKTLTRSLREIRTAGDDGGAHDAGRNGAWALIGDAAAGHAGLSKALAALRKAFLIALSERRGERVANEEWARIVIRGVQKVAAEGDPQSADLCALLASSAGGSSAPGGSAGGSDRTGSSSFDYARDDIGNATRLVVANRHTMRYTDALGGWHVWSEDQRRWIPDRDGEVRRRAISVVRSMETEAEFIEDPTQRAAFIKFVRSSGNIGKLGAMVSIAEDMSGITLPDKAWDAERNMLGTPEAHLELCSNPGVEVRPALPERLMTLSTGTRYVEGARSELWEEFLARFVPDPDVLEWLQRLVGYSLHAGNSARLFVVGFGPTSTGKTTFAEALRLALGDYGGVTNLTIFRDNQDERARADLVSVMRKRFLYAEEASVSWHLHPDQVKRLTGGAPIKARLPFARTYVEGRPDFTPWLFCNNPPTIEGADSAFWRRLFVVPFREQIGQSDEAPEYLARLSEPGVREAVLAWAVRGWIRYAGNRDLTAPASTIPAYEEFRGQVSDFDTFLSDCCVLEEDLWTLPVTLYSAYKLWCQQNGIREVKSNTAFGKFLSGRGIDKRSVRTDDGPRNARAGIGLAHSWESMVGGAS